MAGTVDKFGRVVIPREMRLNTGLKPGTPVAFHEQDGKVVLEAVPERVELVRKGHVLVFPGDVVGDTGQAVRNLRQERLGKFFPKPARRK